MPKQKEGVARIVAMLVTEEAFTPPAGAIMIANEPLSLDEPPLTINGKARRLARADLRGKARVRVKVGGKIVSTDLGGVLDVYVPTRYWTA